MIAMRRTDRTPADVPPRTDLPPRPPLVGDEGPVRSPNPLRSGAVPPVPPEGRGGTSSTTVGRVLPLPFRERGRGGRSLEGIQLPLIPEDEIAASGRSGLDRVPELTHYRDEGCRFWRACLSCPFPRCVFEVPGGPGRAIHAFRDGEIRRMYAVGVPPAEIADRFGITRRSVYRILGGIRRRGNSGQRVAGGGERRARGRPLASRHA
jgi:hypothetical protein